VPWYGRGGCCESYVGVPRFPVGGRLWLRRSVRWLGLGRRLRRWRISGDGRSSQPTSTSPLPWRIWVSTTKAVGLGALAG
jgi:hypothetical protein